MKEMTVNEALKLVQCKPEPAISLYLSTNVQEHNGASRLKGNLQRLYKTAEALIMRTYDMKTRKRLLEPLKRGLAALRLTRSKGGIAVYHSETFTGVVRLPTPVADLAIAADSFHLKPVLRCAQVRRNYYILAFRRKSADLFLVTADAARLVERIELRSSSSSVAEGAKGSIRVMRDEPKVRRQKNLNEMMIKINRQLETSLHGERMPLLLAGPHHKLEAFRGICSYANVLEQDLDSYTEDLDVKTLLNLSEVVVKQHFATMDHMAIVGFRKAQAAGLASTDLNQIAEAAARGQIQSLLIAEDRQVWGRLDRTTGTVVVLQEREDAKSDDLLDDLGELTLLKGAQVTVLPIMDMPGKVAIAAVFRWSDNRNPLPYQLEIAPFRRPPGPHYPIEISA